MQDKEFLGYFTQLGNTQPSMLIQASNNIVNTLLAVRKVESPSEELVTLHKKYLTGDLGDSMSADLNYALKRLVRGLCSENHAVKQGYFLATSQVL